MLAARKAVAAPSIPALMLGVSALAWCALVLVPPVTMAGHWVVMLPAMMAPLVLPSAQRAVARVYATERATVLRGFLAGYALCWMLAGIPALGLLVALTAIAGPTAVPLAFALAAFWHLTPIRARSARAAHGLLRLPRGDGPDAVALGLRHGLACTLSCGPLMVAAMTTHALTPMLVATILLLTEATSHRPPALRSAILILVLGALPAPHPHSMEPRHDHAQQTDRPPADIQPAVPASA